MTARPLVTDPARLPMIDASWWHREAESCRRDGYPDLEAICREHAAALEYGGFVDLEAVS